MNSRINKINILLPLILLVSLVVFANPATPTGITTDTNISEMASDIRFLKEQVQSLQSENEALKTELSEVQGDVSESRALDASVVHILNGVNTFISNQEKENAKTAIAVESLNEWNWFKDLPVILALVANVYLVIVTRRSVENSIKTSEDQAKQNKKLLDQNATQLDKLERQLIQNDKQLEMTRETIDDPFFAILNTDQSKKANQIHFRKRANDSIGINFNFSLSLNSEEQKIIKMINVKINFFVFEKREFFPLIASETKTLEMPFRLLCDNSYHNELREKLLKNSTPETIGEDLYYGIQDNILTSPLEVFVEYEDKKIINIS